MKKCDESAFRYHRNVVRNATHSATFNPHKINKILNMILNLKCENCSHIYNFEVGELFLDKNDNLVFENKSICPNCGEKDKDLLTESSEELVTAWYMEH